MVVDLGPLLEAAILEVIPRSPARIIPAGAITLNTIPIQTSPARWARVFLSTNVLARKKIGNDRPTTTSAQMNRD